MDLRTELKHSCILKYSVDSLSQNWWWFCAIQNTLRSPPTEHSVAWTKSYPKAAHGEHLCVCLPGLNWRGHASVSLALSLNCPTVQSFARLLQVKVNRDEINRLALARGAAKGKAAVWKSLYLTCQHPEVPREYALQTFCTAKALRSDFKGEKPVKLREILKRISTWDTSYAILIGAFLMDSYCKLLYSNTTTEYTWLQIWPL